MERRKNILSTDDYENSNDVEYASDQSFDPDEDVNEDANHQKNNNISKQKHPSSSSRSNKKPSTAHTRPSNKTPKKATETSIPHEDDDEDDIQYVEVEPENTNNAPSSGTKKKKKKKKKPTTQDSYGEKPSKEDAAASKTSPQPKSNARKGRVLYVKVSSNNNNADSASSVVPSSDKNNKEVPISEVGTRTNQPPAQKNKQNKAPHNKPMNSESSGSGSQQKQKEHSTHPPRVVSPTPKRYSQQNYSGNQALQQPAISSSFYSHSQAAKNQKIPDSILSFKLNANAKAFTPPSFTPVIIEQPKKDTQT
ncbi:hypothetical protein C9374_009756 [Naegleria lovaniensis]|uniref:Uncharacterized protein n=1 Tax=Naegleria lovaniensis TaxID=51637 RepID=A0AA88GYZ6_NAELO|nr:uncharacterized protein C9374_009756 [Naegleria lovaniensis]KAG2393179.1 hypothetical protein C9374_009756 [Naegleria lovaniensis]